MSSLFSVAAHGAPAQRCTSHQPLRKPLAVGFSGSRPQHPLHCRVPASTSPSLGSAPQSIHVRTSHFRLVRRHVANASQNVLYKAQRTLASSAGTRPSCHRAHAGMNCLGCRHCSPQSGRRQPCPAQRREVRDNQLTNFYRMLWKFCLYLQWFVLLKCLTCLQRSSLSSTHGVVEPDHPLLYWEFLQGTTSDVQRGPNMVVSLLLGELEKQRP